MRLSLPVERCEPLDQIHPHFRDAFAVAEVGQMAMVAQVERDVVEALRDRYDMFAERMSDAGFVKDIWVLPSEITDHDEAAEYQRVSVVR